MIISASYKTDIPTFYGEWFMNRLRAGYCKMVNPYNQRVIHVPLTLDKVDGIVFWTKNIGPFIKHLPEIKDRGFAFAIQHTINGYPRTLEQAVVDSRKSVEYLRQVSGVYGPRSCVWRYDTILNTSLTPREFHLDTFAKLAKDLEGVTDEVVISFAHFYKKTLRNMKLAAEEFDFTWSDPDAEWKRKLASELAEIAQDYSIQLTLCSQPQFMSPSVSEARCVDAKRISDISGKPLKASLKGNREGCGCFESRDIGDYDTCPHGCVYCYAVQNQELAKSRHKLHDPKSESLFPLPPSTSSDTSIPSQTGLFD
jgi:hypothetical protein